MEDKLNKVRKLLELSKSSNINEASAALAAAQKLMIQYEITELALNVGATAEEKEEGIEDDILFSEGKQLATWRRILGNSISDVNGCKYYSSGDTLRIVGQPSKASTVRYLFSYVSRQIEEICENEAIKRGRPGRTWCNNFKLGAVHRIKERLSEIEKEARSEARKEADRTDILGNGMALVKVDQAIAKIDKQRADVGEWAKRNLRLRMRTYRSGQYDSNAREVGRRAADKIDLGGKEKRLSGGARALPR